SPRNGPKQIQLGRVPARIHVPQLLSVEVQAVVSVLIEVQLNRVQADFCDLQIAGGRAAAKHTECSDCPEAQTEPREPGRHSLPPFRPFAVTRAPPEPLPLRPPDLRLAAAPRSWARTPRGRTQPRARQRTRAASNPARISGLLPPPLGTTRDP